MSLITSTPKSQTAVAPIISKPSPGTWRHPRFDEIAQRKNAATFSDRNVRTIVWNAGALLVLWIAGHLMDSYPDLVNTLTPLILRKHKHTLLVILHLVFIFNIAVSFLPLLKQKDNLTDIPLTPSQRALLGLDPHAAPPDTPTTQCHTPPRYPRSSIPRNSSPASRGSNSTRSPLSRNASPLLGGDGSESPFSASASSIWQKSVGGSRDSLRRNSFGTPSPRGIGANGNHASVLGTPGTPSPLAGKGANVGLNSKWLYERGRIAPGSRGPKIFS